jgi:myosin-crossreactive antigen
MKEYICKDCLAESFSASELKYMWDKYCPKCKEDTLIEYSALLNNLEHQIDRVLEEHSELCELAVSYYDSLVGHRSWFKEYNDHQFRIYADRHVLQELKEQLK